MAGEGGSVVEEGRQGRRGAGRGGGRSGTTGLRWSGEGW